MSFLGLDFAFANVLANHESSSIHRVCISLYQFAIFRLYWRRVATQTNQQQILR